MVIKFETQAIVQGATMLPNNLCSVALTLPGIGPIGLEMDLEKAKLAIAKIGQPVLVTLLVDVDAPPPAAPAPEAPVATVVP